MKKNAKTMICLTAALVAGWLISGMTMEAQGAIVVEYTRQIDEFSITAGKDKNGFEEWTYHAKYRGLVVQKDKQQEFNENFLDYEGNALQNFVRMLQGGKTAAISSSFPKLSDNTVEFRSAPGLYVDGDGFMHQAGSFQDPGFSKLRELKRDPAKHAAVFEVEFNDKERTAEDQERITKALSYLASVRFDNRGPEWFDVEVITPNKNKPQTKHYVFVWRDAPKKDAAKAIAKGLVTRN